MSWAPSHSPPPLPPHAAHRAPGPCLGVLGPEVWTADLTSVGLCRGPHGTPSGAHPCSPLPPPLPGCPPGLAPRSSGGGLPLSCVSQPGQGWAPVQLSPLGRLPLTVFWGLLSGQSSAAVCWASPGALRAEGSCSQGPPGARCQTLVPPSASRPSPPGWAAGPWVTLQTCPDLPSPWDIDPYH